jgi:glyoxylase-like metal-dependent hydrolase (beta-lactamase superfamily II)
VATSSFALTTSTVVVGAAGKCLVIDPGVTVAETAALAAELRKRGLTPAAAWSTHPHWDHVLWCRELGEAPRYAAPAAVQIAETERAGMVEEMQRSAPGHDLGLLGQLTVLDAAAIGWDGPTTELIVHDGHAPGHGAVFLPEAGVLVAGDMCSDAEIPLLDTEAQDAFGDYRAGLAALAAVPGVRQVVPGHGHVGDAAEFRRRLAADSGYLDALALLEPFEDPRITEDWMREAHDSHLRYMRGRALPVPAVPPCPATGQAHDDEDRHQRGAIGARRDEAVVPRWLAGGVHGHGSQADQQGRDDGRRDPRPRGGQADGRQRAGCRGPVPRQVGERDVEILTGLGLQGAPRPLLELFGGEPAELEMLAQLRDGPVAVGVRHPQITGRETRGHGVHDALPAGEVPPIHPTVGAAGGEGVGPGVDIRVEISPPRLIPQDDNSGVALYCCGARPLVRNKKRFLIFLNGGRFYGLRPGARSHNRRACR